MTPVPLAALAPLRACRWAARSLAAPAISAATLVAPAISAPSPSAGILWATGRKPDRSRLNPAESAASELPAPSAAAPVSGRDQFWPDLLPSSVHRRAPASDPSVLAGASLGPRPTQW